MRHDRYLDMLLEIYPANLPPDRPLPESLRETIKRLFSEKKYKELVSLLLSIGKKNYPFPVEHPYASLLRSLDSKSRMKLLETNVELINTLTEIIVKLGPDNIIRGVERPKDINRTLGAAFKSWVQRKFSKEPFKIVNDPSRLLEYKQGVSIYVGEDEKIAEFILNNLLPPNARTSENYDLFSRDILAKIEDQYIIGEARFLSTPGGSQTRDLKNVLDFVIKTGDLADRYKIKIKGIALIDGIVWFFKPYLNKVCSIATRGHIVMSALLLERYFNDLLKKTH